jgi:hypothetical protein
VNTSEEVPIAEYEAIIVQQVKGGPELALFAAPAIEISEWVGIPQRRRVDSSQIETAGFQREERHSRVVEIASFMRDPANVIQNPLLAAVQDNDGVEVVRLEGARCKIRIQKPGLAELSLLQLTQKARDELVQRLPVLQSRVPPANVLDTLRTQLALASPSRSTDLSEATTLEEVEGVSEGEDDASSALFQEETQVLDFFDELNARVTILQEAGAAAEGLTAIGGFTRDFLESLVKPVVLVDGQHRLRGALEAIAQMGNTSEGEESVARLVDEGHDPGAALRQFALEEGRSLPISMLVDPSPAEHVFQFVVVNQKATPMSSALLGTIVSTSLTKDELEPIAERLTRAGIQVESTRAVAYLSRAAESPFRGLVSTGMAGDRPRSLPWSVLLKLANIVRNLEGGVAFHPPRVDQAKLWRTQQLGQTGLIPPEIVDEGERLEHWKQVNGPWRGVFIKLHTKIRDTFGDVSDMSAFNAWGDTSSNLFNMISLSILTVDFFAFLRETRHSIADWDDLDDCLAEWLDGLNPTYFNRNWRMGGTKKDQTAIRVAWSETWAEYRLTRERLPRVERYNPGGRG